MMENRLMALEKRAAFQERLIQELNGVIIDQGKRLDLLEKRVNVMKDQFSEGHLVRRREDEPPPPHY